MKKVTFFIVLCLGIGIVTLGCGENNQVVNVNVDGKDTIIVNGDPKPSDTSGTGGITGSTNVSVEINRKNLNEGFLTLDSSRVYGKWWSTSNDLEIRTTQSPLVQGSCMVLVETSLLTGSTITTYYLSNSQPVLHIYKRDYQTGEMHRFRLYVVDKCTVDKYGNVISEGKKLSPENVFYITMK